MRSGSMGETENMVTMHDLLDAQWMQVRATLQVKLPATLEAGASVVGHQLHFRSACILCGRARSPSGSLQGAEATFLLHAAAVPSADLSSVWL